MIHVLEVNNLLYWFQIKPVSATSGTFPKGLAHFVDRGTLEMCLHLIVLSLSVVCEFNSPFSHFLLCFHRWQIGKCCKVYVSNILEEQVMAGSGHLQTFRLLRFLRSRNSADGHANFGIQMAVSFCQISTL